VGLRELRDLPALSTLFLVDCTHVTDAGLRHLTSLIALTTLSHYGDTSTTQARRGGTRSRLPSPLSPFALGDQ